VDPNLAAAIALLVGASAFFVRMVAPAFVRLIDAGAVRLRRSERIDEIEARLDRLENEEKDETQ
jgi:hypothetical protein